MNYPILKSFTSLTILTLPVILARPLATQPEGVSSEIPQTAKHAVVLQKPEILIASGHVSG
jgi:hypothetical protein